MSSSRQQRVRWTLPLGLVLFGQVAVLAAWVLIPGKPGGGGRALPVPERSDYPGREAGEAVDMWRGVPVRANGPDYLVSHGRHFHPGGYYYGQKWQCVEFAKRFYKDALDHEMPDVMGHAADFFDSTVPHRELNAKRNLVQFQNGEDEPPAPDDLIVWQYDGYGHIAVVTRVDASSVEVIQQNVRAGTRMRLPLRRDGDAVFVGSGDKRPAGWLRRMGGSP